MPIVHKETHTSNFTVISNSPLQDPTISHKAKGLWAFLMTLPKNWKVSARGLTKMSMEGYDSILASLNELAKKGYATKENSKNKLGQYEKGYWTIYEERLPLPFGENPLTENPGLIKKQEERTKIKKKTKKKESATAAASALCDFLLQKIKEKKPDFVDTHIKKQIAVFDEMLDIDKRSGDKIRKVIEWSIENEFYFMLLLGASGVKSLRKNFDKMEFAMNVPNASKKSVIKNEDFAKDIAKKYNSNKFYINATGSYLEIKENKIYSMPKDIYYSENGFQEQVMSHLRKIGVIKNCLKI